MQWIDLYSWYAQLANSLAEPIHELARGTEIPILVALILGVAGATAPCQISTNMGAFGYIARYSENSEATFGQALGFVAGKILTYSILGGTVIFLGTQMESISEYLIPAIEVVRKGIGPVFLISGLAMLGVFKFQSTVGEGLKNQLLRIVPKRGAWGAFLLGIVFSLAFCPTLFLLFFGTLVPLGMQSTGGIFFPAVFAVGTAVPLLFLTYLLVTGSDVLKKKFIRSAGKFNRIVTKVVAVLFILLGINDTFLYWLL